VAHVVLQGTWCPGPHVGDPWYRVRELSAAKNENKSMHKKKSPYLEINAAGDCVAFQGPDNDCLKQANVVLDRRLAALGKPGRLIQSRFHLKEI